MKFNRRDQDRSEGFRKAFRRVSIYLFSELFALAAQLRAIKGLQTNQGVLNNFGETSNNKSPHTSRDPTFRDIKSLNSGLQIHGVGVSKVV